VKTAFHKSFARALKKVKDRTVLERFREAIEEFDRADELYDVSGVKHMSCPGSFSRLRIGDYRVGIVAGGNEVEFVRFLYRRDIYGSSGLSVGGDGIASKGGAFLGTKGIEQAKGPRIHWKPRPLPSFNRVARQQSPTDQAFWRFRPENQEFVAMEAWS